MSYPINREELAQAIDRFNMRGFAAEVNEVILSADVTYFAGGDFLITILREDNREQPEAIHAIYDSLVQFEDFQHRLDRVLTAQDLRDELGNLADEYNEAITAGAGNYLLGVNRLKRAAADKATNGVEWKPRFHVDGGAAPRVLNVLADGTPIKATLGRNVLYGTTIHNRDSDHLVTIRAAGSPKGYEFQAEYSLWFKSGWQFRIINTTMLEGE